MEATDLKPTQLSQRHSISKSPTTIDPFVNITVDEITLEKTTAKPRTFRPVWNEVFDLQLIDASNLELIVFHKSAFPHDTFVSNCLLHFEDFFTDSYKQTGYVQIDDWVRHR